MRMADISLMAITLGIYMRTPTSNVLKSAGSARVCEECFRKAIDHPEGPEWKKLCAAITERLAVRYRDFLEAGKA